VSLDRIRRAMRRERFAARVLTERELQRETTPSYVAGRWAAKEAIAKAVSVRLGWRQVEVIPSEDGRLQAHVHCDMVLPGDRVWVSVSHERGQAVAVAIWERATPPGTSS
jgi:holo-[acyl-carrier protein] synthase